MRRREYQATDRGILSAFARRPAHREHRAHDLKNLHFVQVERRVHGDHGVGAHSADHHQRVGVSLVGVHPARWTAAFKSTANFASAASSITIEPSSNFTSSLHCCTLKKSTSLISKAVSQASFTFMAKPMIACQSASNPYSIDSTWSSSTLDASGTSP